MVSNKREKDKSVSSIFTEKHYVPPWCSSSRAFGKRKLVPRRDSIRNVRNIKRKSLNKHPLISVCNIILFIFFLLAAGFVLHRISDKMPGDLMPNLRSPKFIYPMLEESQICEECCHKMRHLSLQLDSKEKALRKALRVRKTGPGYELARTSTAKEPREVLVQDARAISGADTTEWGTRLALWGLIPLWQAAPPPDTVLSLRPPTPADCWPFSGSRGELIVNLPSRTRMDSVSIEHVRPDTAKSAPRNFIIYGTLANGTWIKLADGVYQRHLPTKQYYWLQHKNLFWDKIVFKVLSNQGNLKYTCIYRFHLYKYCDSN